MCTFDRLILCLGAMRTLPTKVMISLLIYTTGVNMAILPLYTLSAIGLFLLYIFSFAFTPSRTHVLPRLCLCCCSSDVITPLSALGIVTYPSIFRVSRAIAETKGCALRKCLCSVAIFLAPVDSSPLLCVLPICFM